MNSYTLPLSLKEILRKEEQDISTYEVKGLIASAQRHGLEQNEFHQENISSQLNTKEDFNQLLVLWNEYNYNKESKSLFLGIKKN